MRWLMMLKEVRISGLSKVAFPEANAPSTSGKGFSLNEIAPC